MTKEEIEDIEITIMILERWIKLLKIDGQNTKHQVLTDMIYERKKLKEKLEGEKIK